jgi:hypothetical protein
VEVRSLAALVGFAVGDRSQSLHLLLLEVESAAEFAGLAARRLAAAGVTEASRVITDALRRANHTEIDLAVSYLEALYDLGVRLKDEDQGRLRRFGAWEVDTALAQWHSASAPNA